eukprot:403355819
MYNTTTLEYERWEVCVKAGLNINAYVGYARAQFLEEGKKFVVVKARGFAIENALKVVQLVKENMGDIHSQTRFYLMNDGKTKGKFKQEQKFLSKYNSDSTRGRYNQEDGGQESFGVSMHWGMHNSLQLASDKNRQQLNKDVIQNWQQLDYTKYKSGKKVIPAVEVILSLVEINPQDPGYQKPSIRIQTIFSGGNPSGKRFDNHGSKPKNFSNQFIHAPFSPRNPPTPQNSSKTKQKLYGKFFGGQDANSSINQSEKSVYNQDFHDRRENPENDDIGTPFKNISNQKQMFGNKRSSVEPYNIPGRNMPQPLSSGFQPPKSKRFNDTKVNDFKSFNQEKQTDNDDVISLSGFVPPREREASTHRATGARVVSITRNNFQTSMGGSKSTTNQAFQNQPRLERNRFGLDKQLGVTIKDLNNSKVTNTQMIDKDRSGSRSHNFTQLGKRAQSRGGQREQSQDGGFKVGRLKKR